MSGARRTIRIERVYDASLDDVWDMWTTPEGIEAWWGPSGFTTTVEQLELRPGGAFAYVMTATGAEQIAFMDREKMPRAHRVAARVLDVKPKSLFVLEQIVDFVPGVAPYETTTRVELSPSPSGVALVVTLDAMHDEVWTSRAVMGWESELGKLAQALGARRAGSKQ